MTLYIFQSFWVSVQVAQSLSWYSCGRKEEKHLKSGPILDTGLNETLYVVMRLTTKFINVSDFGLCVQLNVGV